MPSCHRLSALMLLLCFVALIHKTFFSHGATGLRNLRPTRSSYGVFPSSPGRNQLVVAAACVTSHAQAVMSLRDLPPETHLCAVPQDTNLRLELFDCTFRKPIFLDSVPC